MIPTPDDPVGTLVFFLAVFAAIGIFFLFIHLLMGKFIRPSVPDAEKLTIYECGEPTVGSAWIQFDLRFYVVALLFVIFDVEVAFFFPWATVFGKANQLANLPPPPSRLIPEQGKEKAQVNPEVEAERKKLSEQLLPTGLSVDAQRKMRLIRTNEKNETEVVPIEPNHAASWARIAFWDILVFFGVLMVGFAYVWRRGDIDWVRAYHQHQEPPARAEKPMEEKVVA
jgi:NADH-quinone oxidoreductase subunit A